MKVLIRFLAPGSARQGKDDEMLLRAAVAQPAFRRGSAIRSRGTAVAVMAAVSEPSFRALAQRGLRPASGARASQQGLLALLSLPPRENGNAPRDSAAMMVAVEPHPAAIVPPRWASDQRRCRYRPSAGNIIIIPVAGSDSGWRCSTQ